MKILGTIARDLPGVAGIGGIVAGVAMMHVPSALIVGGMFLLAIGVLLARRS